MAFGSVPTCLLSVVPVLHPPHLDGDPLHATEILPGPPSLDSIRQLPKRNDYKKPVPPLSYLPSSDPGTTYIGLAGVVLALKEGGPRRKRSRMDGGPPDRAQRASARNLAGPIDPVGHALPSDIDAMSSQFDQDTDVVFLHDDRFTPHSRSPSMQLARHASDQIAIERTSRRMSEKGRGKQKADTDGPAVKVKEEPVTLQLSDIPTVQTNDDHCSSCSSVGALVYCDGCPRAFHLWCLDPPMDPTEFPDGEDSWYCPGCRPQASSTKLPYVFLSPLLQHLQSAIPVEFRLPEDIRSFFRDVGTGPGGTYIDTSSVKTPRIGRHGLGEERDPYRFRDSRGFPVLCFKCGKSARPEDFDAGPSSKKPRRPVAVTPYLDQWKGVISCDFCPLHWHIDCLNPPLSTLPPLSRKWRCPNHINFGTRSRVPKASGPMMDITDPGRINNGNIEIVDSDVPAYPQGRVSVDEILINGRKYRVPERVIILDFWNRLKEHQLDRSREIASILSSPLTSLSSLDDRSSCSSPLIPDEHRTDYDSDTLKVAGLLCQLQTRTLHRPSNSETRRKRFATKSVQTEPDDSVRLERQDTEHLSGLMKAAFKNLDLKQGVPLNGRNPARVTRSTTHTPISTLSSRNKKSVVNGTDSTRASRSISFQNRSQYGHKMKEVVTTANGKTINGHGSTVTQAFHLSRSFSASESANTKSSSSPLKIRIPGRLQHKASTATTSSVESNRLSSVISLQSRPRRSLRRPASTPATTSERSISLDGAHDGH
ncbi:hypothetical protein M0805_003846 [Coniferiporia weirii]|nr:hypothetical protein M0805_003846 [Coniferiporia weirii]